MNAGEMDKRVCTTQGCQRQYFVFTCTNYEMRKKQEKLPTG